MSLMYLGFEFWGAFVLSLFASQFEFWGLLS